MWLPDWLYEAMPFLYACAGLVAVLQIPAPAGYGVGVLLVLAAVLILKMRYDYRKLRDTLNLARYLADYSSDSSD